MAPQNTKQYCYCQTFPSVAIKIINRFERFLNLAEALYIVVVDNNFNVSDYVHGDAHVPEVEPMYQLVQV